MSTDRRYESRVPIELFVDETSAEGTYFQRTANVSRGGMFLDNTIPHPVGTVVDLEFALPGDPERIRVRAEIVNAITDDELAKAMGMGLKFLNLSAHDADRLEAFILEITTTQGKRA